MFRCKFVYILLLSLACVISFEVTVKNANNYGVYTLSFADYGDCKGPKSKNITIMKTALDHKSLIAFINFTFLVDAKIDEVKIQVTNIKDNKKSFLWNYKLNDPCKHYAFAAMIKQKMHSDNCLIKKGNYTCVLNYKEVTAAFLGTSFFYGTYTFKAVMISKKGNIGCFNSTLVFTKISS